MADLPTFKQSEQVEAQTSPVGFGQAGRELASASNILSSIGSTVAINASVERNKLLGAELGQNPGENFLPALTLTTADKAFNEAYTTSANATLSNQFNEFLQGISRPISEANKLTPQMLEDFDKSSSEGIFKLLEIAPASSKDALKNKFFGQVNQAKAILDSSLIKQGKAELLEQFSENNVITTEDIFNASVAGDNEAAKADLKLLIASNNDGVKTSLISKEQSRVNIETAKKSLETGKTFAAAMVAKDKGELPEFLHDMVNKPNPNLTEKQQIDVSSKVMDLISRVDSAESLKKSTAISVAKLKAVMGQFDSKAIEELSKIVNKKELAEVLAFSLKRSSKQRTKENEVRTAIDNFSDSTKFSDAGEETNKIAFNSLVNHHQQENPNATEFESKVTVASFAAGPIKSFVDMMNTRTLRGEPKILDETLQASNTMLENSPQNIVGMSTDAKSMLAVFQAAKAAGQDINVAAANAKKSVLELTEQQRLDRRDEWVRIKLKTYGRKSLQLPNANRSTINALKMLDLSVDDVVDATGLSSEIQRLHEVNYNSLGSESLALERTISEININWGWSEISGKKMFVRMPVEKALNIGKEHLPLVRRQMYSQIEEQIKFFNSLHNPGDPNSTAFTYKVVRKDAVSDSDFLKAKEELDKIDPTNLSNNVPIMSSKNREKRAELQSIIKRRNNPGGTVIHKVWNNGLVEKFIADIETKAEIPLHKGAPVYAVALIDEHTNRVTFEGVNGLTVQSSDGNPVVKTVVYLPDLENLNKAIIGDDGEVQSQVVQNSIAEHNVKAAQTVVDNGGEIPDEKIIEILGKEEGQKFIDNNSVENTSEVAVSDNLGHVAIKEESGGVIDKISTGKDDPGKESYGLYQLSSKKGKDGKSTLGEFLEQKGYADEFKGLEPATEKFDKKWKEMSKDSKFIKAQRDFIMDTHFKPVRKLASQMKIPETAAINEFIFSASLQHGFEGNREIFRNAKITSKMSEAKIIRKLYDSRTAYMIKLPDMSTKMKFSIRNRYKRELRKILGMIK